jgi:hypothetical protein
MVFPYSRGYDIVVRHAISFGGFDIGLVRFQYLSHAAVDVQLLLSCVYTLQRKTVLHLENISINPILFRF